MNSPRHQEMDKLQTIDRQRGAIQQKLDERLPRQHSQLAALVSATKWRLSTLRRLHSTAYTQDLVETTTKKLRMEVGAFEYAAKEQSELLTRALFQLDDVLSHGDAAIKDARKALVLAVQQLLERADQMNAKAASLKTFMERTIDRLPDVPEDADEPMEGAPEEVDSETAPKPPVTEQDDDWEHVHAEDVRPLFASDDEDEMTQAQADDATMVPPEETDNNDDDEQDGEEDDEEDDEEEDEEEDIEDKDVQQNEAPTSEQVAAESPRDESASLPVWRPYYQIQKRADGVYLVANLRGVDPCGVQVHAMPQQGVLRISGVKYPTQKDLLLSRLSGAPTFGRFEIVERFEPRLLNLENASQQLSHDGTLQVRLPFFLVHHPRVLRRVSPFQPHGLVVW